MPNMDDVYIPIMHSAMDPRSTACLLKDPLVEAADQLWRVKMFPALDLTQDVGFSAAICAVALTFPCATALPSACHGPFHCEVSFHWTSEVSGLSAAKLWLSKGDCGCSITVEPEVTGRSHHGFFGSTSFCGSKRTKEQSCATGRLPVASSPPKLFLRHPVHSGMFSHF